MTKTIQKGFAALLGLMMIALFALPLSAQAAGVESTSDIGFYVRALIPDNQIDNTLTYFDLNMEPGQSQALEVEVVNETDQDIEVDVNTISASTNRNGVIDYKTPEIRDKTLQHPFSELSAVENNSILVPANGTSKAVVTVTMPEDSYDGVVLGGMVFTKAGDEQKMTQPGEATGMAVRNVYSYVVGVKLSETGAVVAPDFEIEAVEAGSVNYKPAMIHHIRNKEAAIVKDMSLDVAIKNADGKVMEQVERSGVDMAPNSVMPLAVTTSGELAAGEYTSEVTIRHEGREWTYETKFTIGSTEADQINTAVPGSEKSVQNNTLLIILVAGAFAALVVIILLLLVILFRRRKRDEGERKAR